MILLSTCHNLFDIVINIMSKIEYKETELTLEESELPKNIKDILEILLENKVEDITYLDLNELSAISDSMIIGTTLSEVHSRALVKKIITKIKHKDRSNLPVREEGSDKGNWVVLDFINFMVHLMIPEIREMYNLETLWANCKITKILDSKALNVTINDK